MQGSITREDTVVSESETTALTFSTLFVGAEGFVRSDEGRGTTIFQVLIIETRVRGTTLVLLQCEEVCAVALVVGTLGTGARGILGVGDVGESED
jgi:hypothetical protein